MAIVMHGVVDKKELGSQCTRSFVLKEDFEKHLRSTKFAYRKWGNRKYSDELFLSVDDATHAAAEACLIARHYGHEITLFINPWQVETETPYYFHVLNSLLDNRSVSVLEYQGYSYDLKTEWGLKKLRHAMKLELIQLPERECMDITYQKSIFLKSSAVRLPLFCRTLKIDDLFLLKKKGVEIESHGWSHRSISAFTNTQLIKDIECSQKWIKEKLDIDSLLYAVPFGKPIPSVQIFDRYLGTVFLADEEFNANSSFPKFKNRNELKW